jgi:glycogen debranching enzyme
VKELAKKIKTNFPLYYFNEYGYLHDVIVPGVSTDPCIRPNQIYALSLPFPLLDRKKGKSILDVIDRSLFTPFGLRTLSSEHIDFRPLYEGNQWKRDTAYHQGTVWTFLLSDYFDACLYVFGETPEVRNKINESTDILRSHFYESGCINGIAEIFDGLKPFEGKGTVNQAWSVSALIKIMSYTQKQK